MSTLPVGRCPDCGRIMAAIFGLHNCKPISQWIKHGELGHVECIQCVLERQDKLWKKRQAKHSIKQD